MRRLARVLPFALLPLFLSTAGPLPPAQSGGPLVITIDSAMNFSPSPVGTALGSTVAWSNKDNLPHTATATGFFDTGNISGGGSGNVTVRSAGHFGYHCTIHPSMTAVLRVKMKKSVRAAGGFKLRWATAAAPDAWRYDVQVDKPGTGGFVSFRSGASARAATFNPSRTGTYKFRARTHSGGRVSGYSPAMTVVIS